MEEKEYKMAVLYARKSKKGEHIYAFNRKDVLGSSIKSLVMNISELQPLIDGKLEWIKISVMPMEKEEDATEERQEDK